VTKTSSQAAEQPFFHLVSSSDDDLQWMQVQTQDWVFRFVPTRPDYMDVMIRLAKLGEVDWAEDVVGTAFGCKVLFRNVESVCGFLIVDESGEAMVDMHIREDCIAFFIESLELEKTY